MYVNCVYCGYRYGAVKDVPTSMAEILKRHIDQCPEHPASRYKSLLQAALHCCRSYQHGNAAPALAEEMGDAIEKVLALSEIEHRILDPMFYLRAAAKH